MIAPTNILRDADKEGYAVPAFNFSDIWDLQAIIEAAEEESAVIMIAANPLVIKAFGTETCSAMGLSCAKMVTVPILLHQDHAFNVDACNEALEYGFKSVMMDASKYELEKNISMVKSVVDKAHKLDAVVEAEIGRIRGTGIEGDFEGGDFLASPDDCVELVRESGCDSLAIGIGNAHGFYQGKPELNFERLKKINDCVDVPLVLHGGTGIPAEDIKKAILGGISKVNVGTIIHSTYMNELRKELNRLPENPYTLDVMPPVKEKIKAVVKDWIHVCMCNGKAKRYM
ncbi:MAG: class II fructose-bisphosphate aldolase [Oscillospiraceae bacterium]|nr:class II fructose-bisphosphate aldolase [Oscillospiraceae bacterium]MCL2278505.1 class II fructose-bisphosphate aldolase [Oscillospiraceae bacterium]